MGRKINQCYLNSLKAQLIIRSIQMQMNMQNYYLMEVIQSYVIRINIVKFFVILSVYLGMSMNIIYFLSRHG